MGGSSQNLLSSVLRVFGFTWHSVMLPSPLQRKTLLQGGRPVLDTSVLETLIRVLAFYWKVRVISTLGDSRRPNKFYHCFIIVWKYNVDFIAGSGVFL